MATLPPANRSRLANGALHLAIANGRTAESRRFRELFEGICADLGGEDSLSEGQRQLVKAAALMSMQSETMQAEALAGENFDVDAFGALSDRLGRMFVRLGLRRVARDVTPTLAEIQARYAP